MSAQSILEEIRDELRGFGHQALERLERIERCLGLRGESGTVERQLAGDEAERTLRHERGLGYLARLRERGRS